VALKAGVLLISAQMLGNGCSAACGTDEVDIGQAAPSALIDLGVATEDAREDPTRHGPSAQKKGAGEVMDQAGAVGHEKGRMDGQNLARSQDAYAANGEVEACGDAEVVEVEAVRESGGEELRVVAEGSRKMSAKSVWVVDKGTILVLGVEVHAKDRAVRRLHELLRDAGCVWTHLLIL